MIKLEQQVVEALKANPDAMSAALNLVGEAFRFTGTDYITQPGWDVARFIRAVIDVSRTTDAPHIAAAILATRTEESRQALRDEMDTDAVYEAALTALRGGHSTP